MYQIATAMTTCCSKLAKKGFFVTFARISFIFVRSLSVTVHRYHTNATQYNDTMFSLCANRAGALCTTDDCEHCCESSAFVKLFLNLDNCMECAKLSSSSFSCSQLLLLVQKWPGMFMQLLQNIICTEIVCTSIGNGNVAFIFIAWL